jgi:hypothetical protein
MVRKEMFKKSFLLCCIVVFAISAKASRSGNDDEDYILGLRYPKCYDVKIGQNGPDIRYVSYKVRLLFPSKNVVRFYDGKLKAIGWVPFVEPNYPDFCNRKWDHFIDGTIKDNPTVHQLGAQWVNEDRSRMVGLAIMYHSTYSNEREKVYEYHNKPYPNNIIQEVICQVEPFHILPPPSSRKLH